MRVRMASNASVFANRGDPWVSEREGLNDYGRSGFDDPDLDQFTKAKKAAAHEEAAASQIKPAKTTEHRKLCMIAYEMNRKLSQLK